VSLPFQRLAYRAWRWWFAPPPTAPVESPASGVERGRYLTDHVAICGDCHTPRTRLGAPIAAHYLAGTPDGPDGKPVPNITPDDETGIGKWDADDVTSALSDGMLPNFDNVQGLMAEVVDGVGGGPGYGDAPPDELRAIAAYLKTIAPIRHQVRRKNRQ
jgi:mono/diheme cytochrome c family protein